MLGRINVVCLILVLAGALLVPPRLAQAQTVVSTYYPAAPVVTYWPERWGLFGLRTAYRPVVSYPVSAAVPVVPAPVRTYYAPPVAATVHYAPIAPVATRYYAPAPVTTYYAPAVPLVVPAPAPVTVRYGPLPVVPYSVVLP